MNNDKDMMYLRVELEHANKELADLRATVNMFINKFDRPEFICPELVYAVQPENTRKVG